MLRILVAVILGIFLYRLIKGVLPRPQTGSRDAAQEKIPPPTELVKDPTCKTYLPQDKAIRYEEHFFCSLECRDKFLKES